MIDANLNRCLEGMRVLEDLYRFEWRRQDEATLLKNWRHELAGAFAHERRVLSRNGLQDHGRQVETESEVSRENLAALAGANFSRVQQSLRVLEEASKVEGGSYGLCEKVRYAVYDLEARCWAKPFPERGLYVLVTRELCRRDPEDVLRISCEKGAAVIQLREKSMEDGAFLDWMHRAKEIADETGTPLIVNDRVHLLQLADFAGVHMGQGDLQTSDARKLMRPWQWLGRSTHAIDQALQAEAEGVDYIGVGPLYLTQTKEHRHAVGLSYLREVNEQVKVPYVGIGSVNREHIDEIMVEEPKGLAICTGIISADDPAKEMDFFMTKMGLNPMGGRARGTQKS